MSNTDSTAWLHINQRCGGDCIYCQLKEAKARIKELEAELAEEIFVSDAAEKRIAELEKVAEAAEKYLTKKGIGNVLLYDGLFNALRAAGYLK